MVGHIPSLIMKNHNYRNGSAFIFGFRDMDITIQIWFVKPYYGLGYVKQT